MIGTQELRIIHGDGHAAQARLVISDTTRFSVTLQTGDRHDVSGHHRYYGSSATNGGEQIVESRRGARPRSINLCGF
jgi:hypothetical protein